MFKSTKRKIFTIFTVYLSAALVLSFFGYYHIRRLSQKIFFDLKILGETVEVGSVGESMRGLLGEIVMVSLLLNIILIFFLAVSYYYVYSTFLGPVNKLNRLIKKTRGCYFDVFSSDERDGTADEASRFLKKIRRITEIFVSINDKIETIIKFLPVGIAIVSKDGSIIVASRKLTQILGYFNPKFFYKENKNIFELFDLGVNEITSLILKTKSGFKLKYVGKGKKKKLEIFSAPIIAKNGDLDSVVFYVKDLDEIADYVRERLLNVTPILQNVALGDFAQNIPIPKDKDEFIEHFVALNLMIDDFKEMVESLKQKKLEIEQRNSELEKTSSELKNVRIELEKKVSERTKALEDSKKFLEKKVRERTEELVKLNENLEKEVEKRTGELEEKVLELEQFNKIAVGRELKMVELKEEIEKLKKINNT